MPSPSIFLYRFIVLTLIRLVLILWQTLYHLYVLLFVSFCIKAEHTTRSSLPLYFVTDSSFVGVCVLVSCWVSGVVGVLGSRVSDRYYTKGYFRTLVAKGKARQVDRWEARGGSGGKVSVLGSLAFCNHFSSKLKLKLYFKRMVCAEKRKPCPGYCPIRAGKYPSPCNPSLRVGIRMFFDDNMQLVFTHCGKLTLKRKAELKNVSIQ